ncbi:SGNH/GDSL hydrolase family protein [Pseudonocardia sp. WMMC193]|uniref:SGNH/GDSL hydrolase family protein n=1 Tax=Pseudonocardia sp. WMMC193 TaxID=2911965 RepID=UPI001F48ABF8|nr:SGNH/GDSL hydrolase family protein [Pseudonocardia sp. WMMC193]MCF7548563.1 SGNH/GDSL hydrolase family protein [Pseudonocardia sp. WMMC193]
MRYDLVVIGDSFAEGRGDPDGNGGFTGWVPRVAHRLGLSDVLNLGEYGATTTDVVERQLAKIADVDTDELGVAVGGNDLVRAYDHDGFRRNLTTIFDAVAAPGRRVFTHDYPDIPGKLPGLPPEHRDALRARFAEANDFLAALCAERGVVRYALSTAPLCADPDMWYPDGIHPSALGHRTIADEIATLLS